MAISFTGIPELGARKFEIVEDFGACNASSAFAPMSHQTQSTPGEILQGCRGEIESLSGDLQLLELATISQRLVDILHRLDLAIEILPEKEPLKYVREVKSVRGKAEQARAIRFIFERYQENGESRPVSLKEIQSELGNKSPSAIRTILSQPIQDGLILRAHSVHGGYLPGKVLPDKAVINAI